MPLDKNNPLGYLTVKAHINNEKTLGNIASKGLFGSSEDARLRSYDGEAHKKLSVNLVDLDKPYNFHDDPDLEKMRKLAGIPMPFSWKLRRSSAINFNLLSESLERETVNGSWMIAIERTYKNSVLTSKMFESRMASSVFFILKAKEDIPFERLSTVPFTGNFGSMMSMGFENTYYQEARTTHLFQPSDILWILAPKELVARVKKIFPHHEIKSVDSKKESMMLNLEFFYQSARPSQQVNLPLCGPDYQTALIAFLNEKKEYRRFACHLTRLYTGEDMFRICRSDLSLEEALEYYEINQDLEKQEKLNQALRRSACYDLEGNDIDYFIREGANVNAQDFGLQKNTALHVAISKNNVAAITRLLQYAPLLSIKNAAGKTPLDLAKSSGIDIEKLKNPLEEKFRKSHGFSSARSLG